MKKIEGNIIKKHNLVYLIVFCQIISFHLFISAHYMTEILYFSGTSYVYVFMELSYCIAFTCQIISILLTIYNWRYDCRIEIKEVKK